MGLLPDDAETVVINKLFCQSESEGTVPMKPYHDHDSLYLFGGRWYRRGLHFLHRHQFSQREGEKDSPSHLHPDHSVCGHVRPVSNLGGGEE